MANDVTDTAATGEAPEGERSLSRSALPYLMAAVVASAAMAWYFFVYVPEKLDYFVGLKFRTLAVASGHVQSKVENLARALRSAPGLQSGGDCRAATRPDVYISLVLPDIWLDEGGKARQPGLRLSVCGIGGSVAWRDVAAEAAAASRRDFDDLVIADGNGDVIWQRETSTPRIGNLSELLGAADDQQGWLSFSWRERATVPVAADRKNLRSTAVLKSVNLGGVASLLLVQAVPVAADGIEIADSRNPGAIRQLYVAGLVSRAELQRQARRIPVAWMVLFALPMMLLFLAIPFVKLLTLTSKERFRFTDLVAMFVATIAAAGLGAIVPFVSAPARAVDPTLDAFGRLVETRLADETAAVLQLADRILKEKDALTLTDCADPRAAVGVPAGADRRQCGLWQALRGPASLELDVVVWFNDKGDQIRKWTTKAQITGPVSHRPYDHFRNVTSGRLWTFRSGTGQGGAVGPLERPFTIDPLRAPTTSELGVVFAMPASLEPPRTFLALNVRPQSVVDSIVPPGYGFAIIAPSGRVLFHSNEGLSLEENFFSEVGDPDAVRERSRSGRIERWSGDYHGRPHRFRMQPVTAFVDCPWLIVTFQETDGVLAAEVLQQSGTLRLGILNLALLVTLVLGIVAYTKARHRRTRDLVQAMLMAEPVGPYRFGILLGLAAVEMAAILATYLPTLRQMDRVYGIFVAVPVITLLVTLVARRAGTAGSARRGATKPASATYTRLAAAELGLLVLLVSALPAVGFARIVHVVRDVKDTERWLEEVNQQWVDRQGRVEARVNSPNYAARTREYLRAGFASDRGALDVEAPYAYLGILPRVRPGAAAADAGTDAVSPSDGQTLVRWLLDWNVFSSDNEPGRAVVLRSLDRPQLSASVMPGRPALAGVEVDAASPDLSPVELALGLAILALSIAAVYWARGRLLWRHPVSAPGLEAVLSGVPDAANVVVLAIGAPRTRKDEAVERTIAHATGRPPVERIRLLDAMTQEDLDAGRSRVERAIDRLEPAARLSHTIWIHVSNLESHLVDEASRARVFHLLESLLHGPRQQRRALVVTSSVDPIAHFKELFSAERGTVYTDEAPEVSLSRSALLLSLFRRCYVPLGRHDGSADRHRRLWASWWQYDPSKWREVLALELPEPLEAIGPELTAAWAHRREVPYDMLVREVRARAAAYYELLWTSCTRSEKLVLIQLAQEGFVTAQSWDVVAPLVASGIVVEQPVLTIFNRTFRDFLRETERGGVVQEWERMEGSGLWVVAGRLIGASLLAGGMFYLVTQDFALQSLLPIVSGTGLFGAPLLRTLVARVSGKTLEGLA